MNERDKAVVDAAREQVKRIRECGLEDIWRTAYTNALAPLVIAALDAFPAEPQPETVRDVADLRDGDAVSVTLIKRGGMWYMQPEERNGGLFCSPSALEGELVRAGAVTRPPRPEPDPSDVERLTVLLREHGHDSGPYPEFARRLLRSGEITLRDPS